MFPLNRLVAAAVVVLAVGGRLRLRPLQPRQAARVGHRSRRRRPRRPTPRPFAGGRRRSAAPSTCSGLHRVRSTARLRRHVHLEPTTATRSRTRRRGPRRRRRDAAGVGCTAPARASVASGLDDVLASVTLRVPANGRQPGTDGRFEQRGPQDVPDEDVRGRVAPRRLPGRPAPICRRRIPASSCPITVDGHPGRLDTCATRRQSSSCGQRVSVFSTVCRTAAAGRSLKSHSCRRRSLTPPEASAPPSRRRAATAQSGNASGPRSASSEASRRVVVRVGGSQLIRVAVVVEVHRRLRDRERVERVDHDRQLLGRLLADRRLDRARMRPVRRSPPGGA